MRRLNRSKAGGGYKVKQVGGYKVRQVGGYKVRQLGGYKVRLVGGYKISLLGFYFITGHQVWKSNFGFEKTFVVIYSENIFPNEFLGLFIGMNSRDYVL